MRKENTFAIQPLPEMFLLWEWIFSAGPLQKPWSSPLEPTDLRHFCSFLPLLLPDPICPRSTFGTSHSTSVNGCLENPLQAWPKKLNQWMLFCSLPHNYSSPFKNQRKCFHVNATLTGQLFSKKWILETFALPPLCLLEMSYRSAVCSVSVSLRS